MCYEATLNNSKCPFLDDGVKKMQYFEFEDGTIDCSCCVDMQDIVEDFETNIYDVEDYDPELYDSDFDVDPIGDEPIYD